MVLSGCYLTLHTLRHPEHFPPRPFKWLNRRVFGCFTKMGFLEHKTVMNKRLSNSMARLHQFAAVAAILMMYSEVQAYGGTRGAPKAIGISLFFNNGSAPVADILGDKRRHIDELDIVSTFTSADDQGIQPVIESGDMAGLDWRNVKMVEEDWRPDGQGTFTRQRFYRGAKWMERRSWFLIFQADDDSLVSAVPFIVGVGGDNELRSNNGFIRRFSPARLLAVAPPSAIVALRLRTPRKPWRSSVKTFDRCSTRVAFAMKRRDY